jgi:hypothetical protein
MSWSDADERDNSLYDEDEREDGTFIEINGARIEVEPGTSFGSRIVAAARDAGYGKFRVFLNGNEITDPKDAPEIFNEGDYVAVTAYDVAG